MLARLYTLRQQQRKPAGRPNLAVADSSAPRESGVADFVGGFAVTAGHGVAELAASFEAAHDDYHSIMTKALADRLAEALAERMHEQVRREWWGYAPDESLGNADLIAERYQGIRPAPGYPALPDHTEKETLFRLLGGPAAPGRHHADRIDGDAAGGVRLRPLLLAPGGGVLRRRADRARPAGGLRGAQGAPGRVMARWLAPNLDD